MVDHDVVAVAGAILGDRDCPRQGGSDGGTGWDGQVHSAVALGLSGERVLAVTELRGHDVSPVLAYWGAEPVRAYERRIRTTDPHAAGVAVLAVYAEGARDADAMLGRLVSYFSDTDQPVVLAFWGDHLPYLGDNQIGYRQLGLDVFSGPEGQENLAAYETPYVVWANDAAAEVLDWENAVKALDLGLCSPGYP